MFIFRAITNNLSLLEAREELSKIILDIPAQKNEDNESALIVACTQKNLTWVDFLLSIGANPNDVNSSNQNSLHLLIDKNISLISLSAFIELGIDLNQKDKNGQSPVFYALNHMREDLLHLFLSEGANPDVLDSDNNSPLLLAALSGNVRNVELLLEGGAKTNLKNLRGQNALHMAALSGNEEIVELLIKAGIPKNETDILGRNALHYSAVQNNEGVTKILVKGGLDPNATDLEGLNPLMVASLQGFPEQVEALIRLGANSKKPDQKNESSLIKALKQEPVSIYNILAAEKMEVDPAVKIKGVTNDLSFMNEVIRVSGSVQKDNSSGKVVIKSSKELDAPDLMRIKGSAEKEKLSDIFLIKSMRTTEPDQYAEVAKLLLSTGIPFDLETDMKTYPKLQEVVKKNQKLQHLLENYNSQVTQINSLIEKPEIEHKTYTLEKTNTPKDVSAEANPKDFPLNAKDANGVPYLIVFTTHGKHKVVNQLLEQGHDCKVRNKLGQTALMVAAQLGQIETLKVILKFDKDINYKTPQGENALLLAIMQNKVEAASLLLSAGANPDGRYKGTYYLHLIADAGRTELAQLMIQYGANLRVKDIKGRTPAQYAKVKGHIELEGILGGPKENE